MGARPPAVWLLVGLLVCLPITQAKLCYSKSEGLNGCTVVLEDLAKDVKAHGPKPLPGSLPAPSTRISEFLSTHCTKHSDHHVCPIHFSAKHKEDLIVTGNDWRIGEELEECVYWQYLPDKGYVKSGAITGSNDECPLPGTTYAFARLGLMVVLHLNIVDVYDVAVLYCTEPPGHRPGDVPHSLDATRLYLLSRGQSFYESMYGKVFSGDSAAFGKYSTVVGPALARRDKPIGAGVLGTLQAVKGGGSAFAKYHQITEQTAWKELATHLLADCKSKEPATPRITKALVDWVNAETDRVTPKQLAFSIVTTSASTTATTTKVV